MAAPATVSEFVDLIRKSGVAEDKRLEAYVDKLRAEGKLPAELSRLAGLFVKDGHLTKFQAEQILQGKWRRFNIGKYKVLERLGHGGMGMVYLCEHKLMRRRVAVKVLPTAKAKDDAVKERFYREARAAAALDHPNIVHAYDIDQDGDLHFLVMEYVDGASLQEIVSRTGPMTATRAANYIRQAAVGLEHAHQAGLVHRDIKPGNILVDRGGVVKILDMGLARFFNDQDDILTRKYDENVLGTADYLAPEQALDSHEVDFRADIYSLGATFYFLLTGKTPLGDGTIGQKLMWLHSKQITPVHTIRPDVPQGLSAVIAQMMAKSPAQRFPSLLAVAEALNPWGLTPIKPPLESEMPQLSLAAGGTPSGSSAAEPTAVSLGTASPPPQRQMPSGAGSPLPKPPSSSRPVVPSSPLPMRRPTIPSLPTVGASAAAPAMAPAAEPTTSPATAPADEFEDAPWERLASETDNPSAHLDTAPVSSAHKVVQAKQKQAQQQERRQIGRIAAVLSVITLAALAFGYWKFFHIEPEVGPPARPNLTVAKNNPSGPFSFRTIDQALREAKRGDVIELLDDVHEETLSVDKRRGIASAITIQPAANRKVIWRPQSSEPPMLRFSNVQGFTLRGPGLTLDGTVKSKPSPYLILITLENPGLTIQNVTLKGFSESAVKFINAAGGENVKDNILLRNLDISAPKGVPSFYFDAAPKTTPRINDNIEIFGLDSPDAVKSKDPAVMGPNIRLELRK